MEDDKLVVWLDWSELPKTFPRSGGLLIAVNGISEEVCYAKVSSLNEAFRRTDEEWTDDDTVILVTDDGQVILLAQQHCWCPITDTNVVSEANNDEPQSGFDFGNNND